MKIGDYVRFNFFRISTPIHISQIRDIEYDNQEHCNLYRTDDGFVLTDANIIKSSPNIIDLIEVGDYVNGYYVEDIRHMYDGEMITILEVATGSNYFQAPMYEKDIKSIVTHEQFESMKYKVGD